MQAQSVTLDFLKPVGTVVDLSDKFNARVGDSMTPFNLFVTEGGKPKALNGLHPELEAAVGDGKLKDGKVVMSDNAKGIHWVGSAKNVTGYNRLTLTFPAEVFPQSGFCYGHLILANDAGVRESSVDIWFKVLDGLEIMGLAADYYDSAIELELKKLKEANSQAEQRLSKMKATPEGFANLDDLKAKYPVGNSNLNVTVDDGHLWIWLNGGWRDCGQYQTAGLSAEVKRQIGDLLDGFFKDYLIKNGSFSSGEVAPAFAVGSPAANLTVVNFNGRNWLRIDSNSNVSYGGVGWKIPVSGLSFPLHFETDVSTNDTTELVFYLLGTDAQGNYVNNNFSQLLYSINNEQHAISHVAFDFNLSPELANADNLELRIQIPGEKTIHGINITGVRLYSLYSHNKEYNDNFLAHTISEANMNGFAVMGNGSAPKKEIVNVNNKNWLAISVSNGSWNGLEIADVPNPNVVLKTDCPIHFETNIWNQNNDLSFDVNLVGTKEDGTQFIQFIKTIPLIANKITQLTADIQLAPELRNSSDLRLRIQCADEIALQDLKFSDFVLRFVSVTSDVYNGDLLQQNKLSDLPLAWASNGDSSNIQVTNRLNQQWLRVLINEAKGYSGFVLRSVAINPYNTFYFKSDLLSPNQTKLEIYAIGLDGRGAEIGTITDAILIKTIAIQPNVVNHVSCNFKLPSTMQSAKYVSLRIQQPDEKPLDLMLANAKLTYDNPVMKSKNLIPQGDYSQNSLSQVIALGSEYKFYTTYLNGEEWLRLDCLDTQAWQGIGWDVDSNVDLTRELELHLDLTSGDPRDLKILAVAYDDKGTILNDKSQLIEEVHLPGNNSICHIKQLFKLDDQLKDANFINVRIQQEAKDSLTILVKDIRLWYAADNDDNDNFLAHTISEANMNGFAVMGNGSAPKKEIVNVNNKNWLAISVSNGSWNGLEIADVPNPNVVLKTDCPIHFETNIWNQNNDLSFDVNLVGTKEDGTQFIQFIKTIPLIANKITQLTADIQLAPELRNSSDLRLRIQCADEIALQDLKFSDFVLRFVSVTSDVYNGDLLQQNKLSDLPLAWASNGDSSNIQVTNRLNQQWLRVLINEAKGYSGFVLRSVAINPYNTFYFKSDLLSPNQTKLEIYAIGLDGRGAEIGTITDAILIKTIAIQPNVVNHVSCNFKLPSTMQSAKYVSLRIQQPDEKPLDLMLANAKLTYDNPVMKSKNLIPQGDYSQNSLSQVIALGSEYKFYTTYLNGEEWLRLDCLDTQAWQGIGWDVDSNVDLTRELELHLDLTSGDPRDLKILAVAYDDKGTILNDKSQLIEEVHLPGNNSICHIKQLFKLDDQLKDANFINVRIQQEAKDSLTILVKDIRLWYAADNDDNASDKLEGYNLPTIKINGELAGMNKDDAKKVTYKYQNGSTTLTGYAKLKWQGNSSTMWEKKGYRLQPFTDNSYSKKEKVQFIPAWSPTSKINLKAYYTDGLLSRDVVNANIGADIASTNLSLPNDLKQEDNFGFIDGFPIALIINDEFEGIYSFNTARSDFDYVKYGIMGNGYTNVTNFTSANKADVKLDGSDFESLNPETVTDDEKSAVGDLVTWVATSTDENFKADFEKHLDLKTTIDYFILGNLLASVDSFGKNQIFLTWDGQKWFMQAYDLDTTFGISWEGKEQSLPTGLIGTENNLFKRLSKLFSAEISARYAELRTWLTPAYVLDKYKKRINTIGVGNYKLEFAKWNNPSKDFATYKQLKGAVNHQFSLLDQLWLKK